MYDFIIIGAGYGGLTAASLLARSNKKVLILESHYSIGGCAGFYKREGLLYDVGATTLSGFDYGGPLDRIEKTLNFKLKKKRIDPGMVICFKGKRILRYRNFDKWINELNRHFPGINHEKIWSRIEKVSEDAWGMLSEVPLFPPAGFKDLFSFVNKNIGNYLKLFPGLLISFKKSLPSDARDHEDYISFLDQILMITAQEKSDNVPYLLAALGLNYPKDTFYSYGGMTSMAHEIEKKMKEYQGELKKRRKVYSIEKTELGTFRVEAKFNKQIEVYESKNIVSSIPIWSFSKICSGSFKYKMDKVSKKYNKSWGAMTYYFSVKFVDELDSLYYQVHSDELKKFIDSESLFFSFSERDDQSRSKNGFQVVTVSTHISIELFKKHNFYQDDKEKIKKFETIVLSSFKEHFNKFKILEIGKGEVGTPATFEKYTSRFEGRVGGVPHILDYYPFSYPKNVTPDPNIFLAGDTVFPGQGVVGVISGAFSLVHRILKNEES
ncbi:MAG: hypothetical protein CME68_07355 [Halobacteriovoraceae bacterium]|nr:hypothetical protein [Halobacteriovoraceae bacterium]